MEKLPTGVQPQITVQELIAAEAAVRADPRVIECAAAVGESLSVLYYSTAF